ncbi:AraC family transcriptional regulator [Aquimarina sp. AU474]|uniref:helix-turn-helix domain-containing protein n=1 Tax=Aquimarina sp. AU474 TaxID=2108529 RepID=UPI000D69ABB3|nr:helix-turn-helix domain-containing protein [Aquimarina sp. AU474]
MDTRDTLFLILGLQTLVILLILFLYRSNKNHINKYLGLVFITLFTEIIVYFLAKVIQHPAMHYIPLRFDFLTINFLFLYALKTAGVRVKSEISFYIPAIIEFTVLLFVFIGVLINSNLHDSLVLYRFNTITHILSSIYIITICILIIRVNQRHKALLPIHFTNTRYKSLTWLTVFCISCIVLNVFRHLYLNIGGKTEFVSLVYCGISLLCTYYITIASIIQINIDNIIPSKTEVEEDRKELKGILHNIEQYLYKNQSYLDPNINLRNFAKDINIPERSISKAINRIDNKNFSNYINSYRVEEFKRLLSSGEYDKYSISAIANEVGFSSRASFYKNFKEIVGVSPSVYVKELSA